jgi:hypothetical protein
VLKTALPDLPPEYHQSGIRHRATNRCASSADRRGGGLAKEQLKNVAGFGKEIDHALERIAAIEKHLGISKKIAA